MSWFESLWTRIIELWPFVKVRVWERATRQRFWVWDRKRWWWPIGRGVRVDELSAGVHWAPLWITEVDSEPVVEQTMNLPTQSVTTADGISVSFSTNIVYEVEDVVKATTAVTNFERSAQALAMMHLARRIRAKEWKWLIDNQDDLEKSLKDTLTTRFKGWGVRVVAVGLTDMVSALQLRNFADPGITIN